MKARKALHPPLRRESPNLGLGPQGAQAVYQARNHKSGKGKNRGFIRAVSLLLFWVANLFSACALHYLLYEHLILMIAGLALSIAAGIKINRLSTDDIVHAQHNTYFQIYTKLANQALQKGNDVSDSELSSRAQWQHHNDLRQADKQGRLMQFLKGDAML
jgi:hypothetical protein